MRPEPQVRELTMPSLPRQGWLVRMLSDQSLRAVRESADFAGIGQRDCVKKPSQQCCQRTVRLRIS
jgi:hypothetical protein